jgi:hypothetical protein
MKRMLILIVMLMSVCAARAAAPGDQWLNLGGVSYHLLDHHANDFNPGLGYERQVSDQWTAGIGEYKNSLRNKSWYANARYTWAKDAVFGGDLGAGMMVVTGYLNDVKMPTVQPYVDVCWKYGCVMTVGYVTAFNLRMKF